MKGSHKKRSSVKIAEIPKSSLSQCKLLPSDLIHMWKEKMSKSTIFEEIEIEMIIEKFINYLTMKMKSPEIRTNACGGNKPNELCIFHNNIWRDGSRRIKMLFPEHKWDCLTIDANDLEAKILETIEQKGNQADDFNFDEILAKFNFLLQFVVSSQFQFTLFRVAFNNYSRRNLLLHSPFEFIKPKQYYEGPIRKASTLSLKSFKNLQELILPLAFAKEAKSMKILVTNQENPSSSDKSGSETNVCNQPN